MLSLDREPWPGAGLEAHEGLNHGSASPFSLSLISFFIPTSIPPTQNSLPLLPSLLFQSLPHIACLSLKWETLCNLCARLVHIRVDVCVYMMCVEDTSSAYVWMCYMSACLCDILVS